MEIPTEMRHDYAPHTVEAVVAPMLAGTLGSKDFNNLRYPVYASPKLDGIRVSTALTSGTPLTRKLKEVPNRSIREMFQDYIHCGGLYNMQLDGELMLYNCDGTPRTFNETQSVVMSYDKDVPEDCVLRYFVFDIRTTDRFQTMTYQQRYGILDCLVSGPDSWGSIDIDKAYLLQETRESAVRTTKRLLEVYVLYHDIIIGGNTLENYAMRCLDRGFEGVIIRDMGSVYKRGRSTLKEQGMLKYKPWADAEATITGFVELEHNENPAETDALGYTKRSSAKAFMVPGETLGALQVNTDEWGDFTIGSGLNDELRKEIWDHPEEYLNRVITFKYQRHGSKDKPRFPIFMRFRND